MASTPTIPHSWPVKHWPQDTYPNDPRKAKYLVRAHRDELTDAGALVRVGRELVIIGAPYIRWMQKKGRAVHGYECGANKSGATA